MGRIVHFVVAILLTAAVISTVAAAGRGGGLADAINSGDIAAVRALIKSGADVNQRSGDGSTALLWAAHTSPSKSPARSLPPRLPSTRRMISV